MCVLYIYLYIYEYVYAFIINVFRCVDLYYIIMVYNFSKTVKRKRVEPPAGCRYVYTVHLFIKYEAGVGMLPAEVVCGCDRLFGTLEYSSVNYYFAIAGRRDCQRWRWLVRHSDRPNQFAEPVKGVAGAIERIILHATRASTCITIRRNNT